MSKNKIDHTVTIRVKSEANSDNPLYGTERDEYVGKYLSRPTPGVLANIKVYVHPAVHAVLMKMAKVCHTTGATAGEYLSQIALEHFKQNRELMQRIFDDYSDDLFE